MGRGLFAATQGPTNKGQQMSATFLTLSRSAICIALALLTLAGCSSSGPENLPAGTPALDGTAPTTDAATRASPVVASRPARVFVMAGVDQACKPLPAPQITITQPPTKGDVTFKPGQEATLAATAQGTCVGQKSIGTGIYYTARVGSTGTDRFMIEAKLASGEVATRTFEVKIAE